MILQLLTGSSLIIGLGMLSAGALSGLLAGTFGVGGGLIIVPILYELFHFYGVPESIIMPMCTGTSLAIIAPTAIQSFRGHFKRGFVDVDVLKKWALPILIGVIAGSFVAHFAPSYVFKLIYIFISALAGIHLLYFKKYLTSVTPMPGRMIMSSVGFIIGTFSMLMGMGGGLLAGLYMTFHGRSVLQSISTASGVGVIISISGAIGYALSGWDVNVLHPDVGLVQPPYSIGYVSLVGMVLMAPMGMLTAPIGVKVAHALDKQKLEILFGVFLLLVCLRSIISLES